MGTERSLKKQLAYCDRQEIPIAIIAGSREFENNQVSVKDMRKVKIEKVEIDKREEWLKARVGQKTIPRESLIREIKVLLKF